LFSIRDSTLLSSSSAKVYIIKSIIENPLSLEKGIKNIKLPESLILGT